MTAGGPANRTGCFGDSWLAFQFFRTGRAAALAMVMVAALAVFSIFYVRLTVRAPAETATG
jgi:ABC-type sugar transport system permease subunit